MSENKHLQPQNPAAKYVECMDAVSRVLASNTFRKTARLSSFLQYVCTSTLKGQSQVLTEQNIGHNVFERPAHYNPAEDTIVRTTARLLRQRLVSYYASEGLADPLHIVIPRGAYVPVFAPAPLQAIQAGVPLESDSVDDDKTGTPTSPVEESVSSPVPFETASDRGGGASPIKRRGLYATLTDSRVRLFALGMAVLAVVAILIGYPRSMGSETSTAVSLSKVFWDSLFSANQDTLLIPADSGLVMYQSAAKTQLELGHYIEKKYGQPATDGQFSDADSETMRKRRYTGVVSVVLAAELGKRAQAAPGRFHVRFARDLQLSELKKSNAILVGVRQANPWVQLYLPKLNFPIEWDVKSGQFLIRNLKPLGQEPNAWEFSRHDLQKRAFASIAYVRSLSGEGNTLLIGGTGSAATEAAIEFALNPSRMDAVLKQASLPSGAIGEFEILLQCLLQGDGSTDMQVLSLRTHPQ